MVSATFNTIYLILRAKDSENQVKTADDRKNIH